MRHKTHLVARGEGWRYTACGRKDAPRATNVEADVDCANCLRIIDPDGVVHPVMTPGLQVGRMIAERARR